MSERKFNDPDLRRATRMATSDPEDVALGIACYEGGAVRGRWEGKHMGVAKSAKDAEAWLRGEEVQLIRLMEEKEA